jgi:hypothetical protein
MTLSMVYMSELNLSDLPLAYNAAGYLMKPPESTVGVTGCSVVGQLSTEIM